MVLCLIDGDGNIFRKELLELGLQGGRLAAQLLTDRILDYQRRQGQNGGRIQLWVYVFLNMKGLRQTLVASHVCNQDAFEAFVAGFNQANPRFTINDVHAGKEAADVKIKGKILNHKLSYRILFYFVYRIPLVLRSLHSHIQDLLWRYCSSLPK